MKNERTKQEEKQDPSKVTIDNRKLVDIRNSLDVVVKIYSDGTSEVVEKRANGKEKEISSAENTER